MPIDGRRLVRRIIALTCLAPSLLGFGPSPDDFRALRTPPGVGIVVATIDAGKTSVRSFGASFDGDAPFEIGSLTKTFTATLFADMIVRDEIAADDPIERYLPSDAVAPEFAGRHITLADLATQSSGLPRMPTNFTPADASDDYVDYDDGKMLTFLKTYRLTRAPGARFEYSNLGFGLLGYLLSRRLGMSYEAAIRTRVLEPLGMSHTHLAMAGTSFATVGGHDADGDPAPNWRFAALAGAGAIVSTPNDMLRYAAAMLDDDGPLTEAMRLARQPRRPMGMPGDRIGYAWLDRPDGICWHNGGTAGFRTFLGFDRATHRAIVILANGFVDAVDALGFHALDPSLPAPAPPPTDAVVAADVLEGYVGRYRFEDGSIGTVTRDARGLRVAFDKPPFTARLHATSADTFTIRAVGLDARFVGTGSAATFAVWQPGQSVETGVRLAP